MEKRKFQIMTDSGSDLPQEYFIEKNVECLKLGFILDGVEYHGENGENISSEAFYERLRSGALPTTYQITPEIAKDHMQKHLENGIDVLAVVFSSALSGTANSFSAAAKELALEYPDRKIFVVDSLCASLGQGLFVDYVVRKADEGATIEETYAFAEELKLRISHQFTVNDLFHLKRGGRVSSATAVVGTMMNIKPILHVDDVGRLISIGKVMGRKKSLRKLLENMIDTAELAKDDPVYISHGDCLDDAEYLKSMVEKNFPKNPITINYIGPVIGSHSGCGTVALFFKAKKR